MLLLGRYELIGLSKSYSYGLSGIGVFPQSVRLVLGDQGYCISTKFIIRKLTLLCLSKSKWLAGSTKHTPM